LIKKNELWFSFGKISHKLAQSISDKINIRLNSLTVEYKFQLIDSQEVLKKLEGIGVKCGKTGKENLSSDKFCYEFLFQKFSQENVGLGRWSLKTQQEYRTSFNFFLRYYKELGKPELTHKFLLSYRETLLKLPPNINKYQALRDEKLLKLADMSHERTLSSRQINKYLVCLTSFFKWLEVHEYIDKNPAHNLLLPKNSLARTERNAFSNEEIEKICERIKAMKDELSDRPERFWVPLIGLYSGLRLSEICQLHLEDVKEEAGILSFFINDHGRKRLKNRASERLVPVHPKLKEFGFLEYLKRVGEFSDRLFPKLTGNSVNGYGAQLGRWFSDFNRKYITQDKKKTFHSIRHSVANELKQLQVPSEVISELLGHKLQSITMDRYGKRYRPTVLLAAMLKLGW
jgi:integrase